MSRSIPTQIQIFFDVGDDLHLSTMSAKITLKNDSHIIVASRCGHKVHGPIVLGLVASDDSRGVESYSSPTIDDTESAGARLCI